MENKNNNANAKKLHGNNAKIDPTKHVESTFSTYPVTKTINVKAQRLKDSLVDDGRDFVNENKK